MKTPCTGFMCKAGRGDCQLDEDEKQEFLQEMGLKAQLDKLISACYRLLDLISFLT